MSIPSGSSIFVSSWYKFFMASNSVYFMLYTSHVFKLCMCKLGLRKSGWAKTRPAQPLATVMQWKCGVDVTIGCVKSQDIRYSIESCGQAVFTNSPIKVRGITWGWPWCGRSSCARSYSYIIPLGQLVVVATDCSWILIAGYLVVLWGLSEQELRTTTVEYV